MRDYAELSDQIKDLHGEIATHRISDEKDRTETAAAVGQLAQSISNAFLRLGAVEDAHAALSRRLDRCEQFVANGGKRIGALEDVCAALGRRLTHHELDGHPPSRSSGWASGPNVTVEPPTPGCHQAGVYEGHIYQCGGSWIATLVPLGLRTPIWWCAGCPTFDEAAAALKVQFGQ